mgnify:CR=1 FL=1
MNKPPCYECGIHTPECHGDCPHYGDWVKERAERMDAMRQRKMADSQADSFLIDRKDRLKRMYGEVYDRKRRGK